MPFIDLEAQHSALHGELAAAIDAVMSTGQFILGPAVERFEADFARTVGTRFAIGLNSGTSALHLALLALDVGPGDEVISPAMTFVATQAAVRYCGARPVIVDIAPDTLTMDPASVAAAITPRTKAIMPVHLYGQTAPMDPILELAQRHGLAVIEDAAQAILAEDRGRLAGGIGNIAAFSFYPSKNLGACGEAGAVTTDDEYLASKGRSLRDWGQSAKGVHEHLGYNYRMPGIQGATLEVKLGHLARWTAERRVVAKLYREQLGNLPDILLPEERPESRHVYHVYAAQVKGRDELHRRLGEYGISAGIHYPLPVHLQPCFSDLGYVEGDFPNAERLAKREISLPMFPEMTAAQVELVGTRIEEFIDHR